MTDEVQTTKYRNVSGHLEDLEGGKLVEAGGFVDLSDEQITENSDKLKESFLKVPDADAQAENAPEQPSRDELMAEAGELDIKGRNKMRNDELQTAIIEAKENKDKEGGS